jgi:hypothetical protein
MELGPVVEKLGVGLSRLLRYSFAGFLVIVIAAIVNPTDTETILKAIPWQLTALAAVVVGGGVYAAHRSLFIPVHHLGLCFILYLGDCFSHVPPADSTSPTRWLGSIGVPWFRRMLAYTALRWCEFFPKQEREALDVAHAESGLVVMLAEGFAAAALYAMAYPSKSLVAPLSLFLLAGVFFVASYPSAVGQHRLECMRFRASATEVRTKLQERGILARRNNAPDNDVAPNAGR